MQSVLVAFDGSDQSTAALEYAVQTFPDAEFTVLVGLEGEQSPGGRSDVKSLLRWLGSSRDRADELHRDIATISEDHAVTLSSEVIIGELTKSVVERSETGAFDQVVVPNYSRPDRFSKLFTNVTERIVRRSPLPVTAVKSLTEPVVSTPPETVLVPVDGSKLGNDVLDYACRTFPNARITALNVIDPLILHLDDIEAESWETETIDKWQAEIESHRAEIEALGDSLTEDSEAILDRATNQAEELGVELDTVSVSGDPLESITEYVEKQAFDHVCMGRHSRSKYERFVLGSVTESVLRNCAVPVTTLHRPPEKVK